MRMPRSSVLALEQCTAVAMPCTSVTSAHGHARRLTCICHAQARTDVRDNLYREVPSDLLSGLCHVDPGLSVIRLHVNDSLVGTNAIADVPHASLAQAKQIPCL